MGAIALPASGEVYLDANALIYGVEKNPAFWPLLKPVWNAAQAGRIRFATSTLSIVEVLVGPMKKGDLGLIATYEGLLRSSDMSLLPIGEDVLREAARLRSVIPGLRTPDAIQEATCLLHALPSFISNDAKFRSVPSLPVTILSDLLTP